MSEEQSVALVGTTADTVDLSFLEQSITVTFGTSTAASIQTDLEALLTVSVVRVPENIVVRPRIHDTRPWPPLLRVACLYFHTLASETIVSIQYVLAALLMASWTNRATTTGIGLHCFRNHRALSVMRKPAACFYLTRRLPPPTKAPIL